jgi:hypothetical protein
MYAMNIQMSKFEVERGNMRCKDRIPNVRYDADQKRIEYYNVEVSNDVFFVVNDTNKGAIERSKYHFRNKEKKNYRESVFVLNKIHKDKPMDLVAFYTMLHNPPAEHRMLVSQLDEKPRKAGVGNGFGKNVNILQLERRGGSSNRSSSQDFVWRAADTLDKFDKTKKFYYIPLLGFVPQFTKMVHNVDQFKQLLNRTGIDELKVDVHGVRKGDIETIKKMPNWINLEEHVLATLNGLNTKICMASVMERLDKHEIFNYNYQKVVDGVDAKSPAKVFLDGFVGLPKMAGIHWLQSLMRQMKIDNGMNVDVLTEQYKAKLRDFSKRYPLLEKFGSYASEEDVCEYINLVDTVKGV